MSLFKKDRFVQPYILILGLLTKLLKKLIMLSYSWKLDFFYVKIKWLFLSYSTAELKGTVLPVDLYIIIYYGGLYQHILPAEMNNSLCVSDKSKVLQAARVRSLSS